MFFINVCLRNSSICTIIKYIIIKLYTIVSYYKSKNIFKNKIIYFLLQPDQPNLDRISLEKPNKTNRIKFYRFGFIFHSNLNQSCPFIPLATSHLCDGGRVRFKMRFGLLGFMFIAREWSRVGVCLWIYEV